MGWLLEQARNRKVPPDSESGTSDLFAATRPSPPDFDAVFDTYWDSLFRYCYLRLGSWEDAEDTAQNVLVTVAKGLPEFIPRSGDESFRSWVFTVAHNAMVDQHRRRGRCPEVPFPAFFSGQDHQPSPEDEAMASWEHRWLRDQLAELSDDQRAVIELRLADLTSRAIADILGINHDNVRKLQQRAEIRLRALAADQIGGRHGG